jgi:hypothetical protein
MFLAVGQDKKTSIIVCSSPMVVEDNAAAFFLLEIVDEMVTRASLDLWAPDTK